MKIRAVLKLSNDKMKSAREQMGITLQELERRSGVDVRAICAFQRFDYKIAKAEEKAAALAAVLQIPVDDILPEGVVGQKLPSEHSRTFDADVRALATENAERLCLPSPLEEAEGKEFKERLALVLKTLTYRERTILELRYGLGENEGVTYTLEEVGRVFRVTPALIRSIEAKAIRKMQHPERSSRLQEFVD